MATHECLNLQVSGPELPIGENDCYEAEYSGPFHVPPDLPIASFKYRAMKPFMDWVLAVLMLPVVLPLGMLIAAAIKVTSKGSALYRHSRIGHLQQPFEVWKFRTMYEHGDELLEQHFRRHPMAHKEWLETHKLRNDPRITPIGKFLRKTSLDELPQFINVLAGNMTFIGPRPIVGEERSKYGPYLLTYSYAMPGITGLWQVSGRCDLTYDERVQLDVQYVRHWSLMMEYKILLKTVAVVIRRTGAY